MNGIVALTTFLQLMGVYFDKIDTLQELDNPQQLTLRRLSQQGRSKILPVLTNVQTILCC